MIVAQYLSTGAEMGSVRGGTQKSCWNYILWQQKKSLPIKANSWVAYKKNKLIRFFFMNELYEWMIKIWKHNWLIDPAHAFSHAISPPVWQDNHIYLNVPISETCFAQQREQTFNDSA